MPTLQILQILAYLELTLINISSSGLKYLEIVAGAERLQQFPKLSTIR